MFSKLQNINVFRKVGALFVAKGEKAVSLRDDLEIEAYSHKLVQCLETSPTMPHNIKSVLNIYERFL